MFLQRHYGRNQVFGNLLARAGREGGSGEEEVWGGWGDHWGGGGAQRAAGEEGCYLHLYLNII